MLKKVLIANRGEAALRIMNSCHAHRIPTVLAYAEGDENKLLLALSEESICIGAAPSSASYLNMNAILSAADVMEADSIHPGYGYLSENYQFAETVEKNGFIFIGPTPQTMYRMGDKVRSIELAKEFKLPCMPNTPILNQKTPDEIRSLVDQIGYPVLLKASGGGGGKGIRIVNNPIELMALLPVAQLEARQMSNNDHVYVEKFLNRARHIELQILGDGRGEVIFLGTRDCSLQRRYQKIIEEAPAIQLKQSALDEVVERTLKMMRHIAYRGLGTLEFLYQDEQFYFMEMNTRLQVEHTVTEMITQTDLVYEQLRVAANLPISEEAIHAQIRGHAIQCRINAEDPVSFLPSPGKIGLYHAPNGFGLRMDSAIYSHYTIPSFYDSMIAKLISYSHDRLTTIRRIEQGLSTLIIENIKTNTALHEQIIHHPSFLQGEYSTQFLTEFLKNQG